MAFNLKCISFVVIKFNHTKWRQFLKLKKGRDGLCFDNYCYRYDKTGADGIMYWRCADQRQCGGRIATNPTTQMCPLEYLIVI